MENSVVGRQESSFLDECNKKARIILSSYILSFDQHWKKKTCRKKKIKINYCFSMAKIKYCCRPYIQNTRQTIFSNVSPFLCPTLKTLHFVFAYFMRGDFSSVFSTRMDFTAECYIMLLKLNRYIFEGEVVTTGRVYQQRAYAVQLLERKTKVSFLA